MRIPGGVLLAGALTCAVLLNPGRSEAALEIGVSVTIAPPELPVYEQPEVPGPDYIWTPGFWAWSDDGYYWVPGTWVQPPEPGLLWTPGYWGFEGGSYLWHVGYWGPEIGFYGGVNYGFGYFGRGYAGGYWDRGRFRYNSAYCNVRGNREIVNVYNRTVVNNITVNRISYNGGHGGLRVRPDQHEMTAEHGRHYEPVSAQMHQLDTARGNPDLRANFNHGHPPIAATPHAGEFSGRGVMPARGAPAAFSHAPNAPAPNTAPNAPAPEARFRAEQHGPPQMREREPTPGQGQQVRPAPQFEQQHEQQHVAPTPPSQGSPPRFERAPGAAPAAERAAPAPQFHAPPPQAQFHAPPPPAQMERAAPAPQFHAPPPQAQFHAPPPPAQMERAAPAPQFHAPPPQAQFHAPPQPAQVERAAPAPQFHAPPPQAQFHAPPPPAQVERAAPAPQFHAPPPQQQQRPQPPAPPANHNPNPRDPQQQERR